MCKLTGRRRSLRWTQRIPFVMQSAGWETDDLGAIIGIGLFAFCTLSSFNQSGYFFYALDSNSVAI